VKELSGGSRRRTSGGSDVDMSKIRREIGEGRKRSTKKSTRFRTEIGESGIGDRKATGLTRKKKAQKRRERF